MPPNRSAPKLPAAKAASSRPPSGGVAGGAEPSERGLLKTAAVPKATRRSSKPGMRAVVEPEAWHASDTTEAGLGAASGEFVHGTGVLTDLNGLGAQAAARTDDSWPDLPLTLPKPQGIPYDLLDASARGSGPHAAAREAAANPTFGPYEVVTLLDRGGTAEVFLALRQSFEGFCQCVALKTLRAEYKKEAGARHMFFAEARLGATLTHPNIVHTLDLGEHNGTPYVVTEYLPGQPLHRVLERAVETGRPLTPALAIGIVIEVLDALTYLHELCDFDGTPFSIVHHDISPHNIFITYRGGVKLLDFGIAWISAFTPDEQHQGMLGRPAYMAPEVAAGERVDHRADLFSLGVVLWELIAGRRLFGGKSREESIARARAGDIPQVSRLNPALPASLDVMLGGALAVSSRLRYRNAIAMREALVEALKTLDPKLAAKAERSAREECMLQLFDEERRAANAAIADRLPTLRQRHVDFPVASASTPPRQSVYPAKKRK